MSVVGSRWHRPFSYLVAVCVFLLVIGLSVAVVGFYLVADWASMRSCTESDRSCPSHLVIAYTIAGIVVLFVTPSVLGAILTLKRKRLGVPISLAALILWTSFIAYGLYYYYAWYSNQGIWGWMVASSFPVLVAIMDMFLVIGYRGILPKRAKYFMHESP
jgi:glucan phosphoethanolaminetransferase (alkaline phosphatase superfamily)